MGVIGRVAKKTPKETKLGLIKQFVDGNGGTLRLGDRNTIQYQPKEVRNAAMVSQFAGGGTQGHTTMGGV